MLDSQEHKKNKLSESAYLIKIINRVEETSNDKFIGRFVLSHHPAYALRTGRFH